MATVPTVPNIVSLPRAQDGSIEFWWNPPTSDGGSAITGYTVSCSTPQLQTVLPASAFNTWVQGLTNGQNYTFFMTASNAVGESAPATWQAYQPGFIPSPPTGVGAVQQPTSCNFVVSRSTPTTSTNTVNYWSVQATPADIQFSTIVQAEYGSNLTTLLTNLDTTQTQWQMSARQLTDPGWSDPSVNTPYIGNNRVRTAFITNSLSNFTTIAPTGDTWILGVMTTSSISTCLFNSYGNFVQAIPPQPVNSSYIMYSSADGVSNTWISLINGRYTFNFVSPTGAIDQYGNFCQCITLVGNRFQTFYDKNNTLILSNVIYSTGANTSYALKYSPTGIYNGITDSNTWVASISTNSSSAVSKLYNIDSLGNIYCGFDLPNTNGGSTTVFDKVGSTIGSTLSINTGGFTRVRTPQLVFIKYAYDGLGTNSWVTSWSNGGGGIGILPLPDCTTINLSNEFCVAFAYSGNNGYIYGADQMPIGGVLPYTSTLSVVNYNTCICKFGATGTSIDSWRAIIQSDSDTQYKSEVPISLMIDKNNKFILTGTCDSNTINTNLIPLDTNDSSNILVSQSTFAPYNTFITRYTPNGVPEWITTLGGASTIIGPSTFIGGLNFTKTALDSQNNIYIVGPYNSNSLTMRNNNGNVINTISSPRSNAEVFLAKYYANGTTGELARLGSISTANGANGCTIGNIVIDSLDTIYLTGNYSALSFGFYPSSNPLSPSVSIFTPEATNALTACGFVAKLNSGLSSIQIGRMQLTSPTSVTTITPKFITYDSTYNPIVTYTGNCAQTSTLRVFCMNNYTTIPDYTTYYPFTLIVTTRPIGIISRFTPQPTTSWAAIQAPPPGISSTTVRNCDSSIFANGYGSLYIDSNNRIYNSIYITTSFSASIFDKTGSTVISPQQVAGSSVVASSMAMFLSYPIDGINRLQ